MNVFLRGLLPGLAARGIATDVLTRSPTGRLWCTEPSPGVRVIHLPCGWRARPTRASAWRSLPAFVAGARTFLFRRTGRYDALSAHYWMSGVAARALRGDALPPLPLVFVYHTVEARKATTAAGRRDMLSVVRRQEEERLSREADRLVCFTREDLAETLRFLPAAAGKGTVIPPGVGEPFRHPPARGAARRELGLGEDEFLFLVAGRPDPGKGAREAVEAFSALLRRRKEVAARLWVAGQRAPRGAPPPGVRYLGPVPHAAMPRLYAASDAVVCPSRYESFGLVQLEALACGVPLVVPLDGYWGRRVAAAGGGIAYPATGAEALAGAMEALLAAPALRVPLARQARRIAAPFTWERCTAAWARLLAWRPTPGSRR